MKPKSTLRSFLLISASLSLATPAWADVVPVSSPGGPYLVLAAGNLTLIGSGTPSDTGTTITTYEWDLDDDGDFDELITGATPAAIPYATLTGTYGMTKGSNTISLRVTDDSSPTPLTATATTTVVLDTTTYNGTSGAAGATDTWNIAGRWNAGIPALTSDAVIAASKYVVVNAATGTYSGSLSIGAGSTLQLGWTTTIPTAYNALGNGNVTMAAGSSIATRNQDAMTFASITLTGNAFLSGGSSTQKGATMNFGAISGAYTLSLYNHNSNFQAGNSNLNAANSFSELVLTATDNTSSTVFAKVAGSLGTGDVTLHSGKLTFGTAAGAVDIMANTGVLRINGGIAADRVTMTASDTIGGVTLNGAKQLSGIYGSAETWLGGAGTLTVLGATSAYWDLDGATSGAGGSAPAGTWDGSNTFWNDTANGTGTTSAWVGGQNAIFAAGTGATGTYAVTVSGTQNVAGLGFEEGSVTLSGDALNLTETAPVVVKTGASAIIQSVISQNAAGYALHKSGAGSLTLSGANTYTGGTLIAEGTLNINDAGVAGVSGPLGNGGTFTINGGTIDNTSGSAKVLLNVNPITVGGDFSFSTGGGTANNNLNLPGAVNLGGGTRIITTNGAGVLTLGGNITNGTLTKAGTGTLVLSGTNSHSTTLTGGTLVVVGTGALGTGALTWGTTGTTLQMQQDTNMAVTNTLSTTQRNTTRTLVVDRLTTGAAINLAFSNQPNLDTGTVFNFQKGANINSGTPTVTFSSGLNCSDSLSGTVRVVPTDVNLSVASIGNTRGRTWELSGTSTGNEVTGVITQNNTYPVSVTKTGSGTWTLSGNTAGNANGYTGPTTISEGALLINGTLKAASTVTVNAGTLGGTGTVGGAVTIGDGAGSADAILAPGNSIESLATGNLSFGSDGSYAVEVDGTSATSDQTIVTGTVTINATTTLTANVTGALVDGQKYFIVVNNDVDAVTGTFSGLAQNALVGTYGSFNLKISYTGDSVGSTTTGGNDIVLYAEVSGGGDVTPPTLTSITDNVSGGPVTEDASVTYTVTFNEDIDSATVTTGDFDNQGTATCTINSVVETAPTSGVFTVVATPTTPGTLRLRIPSGAVVEDTSGNDLVVPVSDDTTITVRSKYEAWSGASDFDVDTNGDGVDNGLAFLLGAANKNVSALSLLPTVTQSGGDLILEFDMLNSANRKAASLNVQHSSDLGIGDAWESALVPNGDSTVNDVVFDITAGSPLNGVQATIPASKAAGNKLFGRLKGNP